MGSQQRQPLPRNGSANTPLTRQWLSSRYVIVATATLTYATLEKLLEAVFSAQSILMLYNKDKQDKPVSLEKAVAKSST
jgi:hypothetical protein